MSNHCQTEKENTKQSALPLPPKFKQEWQRRWIEQNREQGGEWSAEDYQLFQRRYFAEDQSGGEFVKYLGDGLEELKEGGANPITLFEVRLSDSETKKTALQRAVSGMLKADWVVLRDLWLEDEDNSGDFDSDELGPEGDSLWSRILAGVGLYEEKETAVKRLEKRTKERADDNATLERLQSALNSAQEELVKAKEDDSEVDEDTIKSLGEALTAATTERDGFKDKMDQKNADWNSVATEDEDRQSIANYLNSFPSK